MAYDARFKMFYRMLAKLFTPEFWMDLLHIEVVLNLVLSEVLISNKKKLCAMHFKRNPIELVTNVSH